MHAAAILHAFCIFHVLNVTVPETIKIGVILMLNSSEPFDVRRAGPAIAIAIDKAATKYNITFDADYRNYTGTCVVEKPVGILSELYYLHDVKAIVGPACSQVVSTAARLAAYLGVPMVSGVGDLVNKIPVTDEFASLTLLSYNLRKLSSKVIALNRFPFKVLYNIKLTSVSLPVIVRPRPGFGNVELCRYFTMLIFKRNAHFGCLKTLKCKILRVNYVIVCS